MNLSAKDLEVLLKTNPDLSLDDKLVFGSISTGDVKHVPTVGGYERKLSEFEMQTAVVEECDRRALANPLYGLLYAIPNGGQRHPAVAAKLKAEGVRPGIPDLHLPVARHSRHSLYLELKVKPNTVSGNQEQWIRQLRAEGHAVEVIYDDPQAAIDYIEWYLTK